MPRDGLQSRHLPLWLYGSGRGLHSFPWASLMIRGGCLRHVLTPRKIGGSGRPSRVVDLLERGDHAGVDLATEVVEEIVHIRLKRRQALG